MQKLLIVFLLCVICARVHASFGGAYVGASGGVAHQSVDFDATYRVAPALSVSPPNVSVIRWDSVHNAEIGKWNSAGEIFAGWGAQWSSWFYLGGRVGGNFSSYDVRHRFSNAQDVITDNAAGTATATQNVKLSLRVAEFSADLKSGYLLSQQALLFGLIGVAANQEKLSARLEQATFGGTGGNSGVAALPLSQRRRKAALRVGCGLEEKLTQRLALNLNYVFTFYPQLLAAGAGSSSAPGFGALPLVINITNGLRDAVKATPRKQLASMGLTYYY